MCFEGSIFLGIGKLEALKNDLRAEHQPAGLTEEMLVDELANHFWRIKRYRYFEASMWSTDGRNKQGELEVDVKRVTWMITSGMAALFTRTLASDEAAFLSEPKTQGGTGFSQNFDFSSPAAETPHANVPPGGCPDSPCRGTWLCSFKNAISPIRAAFGSRKGGSASAKIGSQPRTVARNPGFALASSLIFTPVPLPRARPRTRSVPEGPPLLLYFFTSSLLLYFFTSRFSTSNLF